MIVIVRDKDGRQLNNEELSRKVIESDDYYYCIQQIRKGGRNDGREENSKTSYGN